MQSLRLKQAVKEPTKFLKEWHNKDETIYFEAYPMIVMQSNSSASPFDIAIHTQEGFWFLKKK